MTHIEAIVKYAGEDGMRSDSEYGPLWTNGYLAIQSGYPGRQKERLASTWATNASREDSLALPGKLYESAGAYVRGLLVGDKEAVYVNEALYRALSESGASAFATKDSEPVAFRDGGRMVGLVMPMRYLPLEYTVATEMPTDAQLFAKYACEENGFYLQSKAELRKRFASELRDVARELRDAREALNEAQESLDAFEEDHAAILAKITALDKEPVIA